MGLVMGDGERGRGGREKAWDGVFVAVICAGRVYFTIGCTTTLKYLIKITVIAMSFVFWSAVVISYNVVLNSRLCARQFAFTTCERDCDMYTSNLKYNWE